MEINSRPANEPMREIIGLVLLIPFSCLAILTIISHVTQLMALPFWLISLLGIGAIIAVVFLGIKHLFQSLKNKSPIQYGVLSALVLVGLACAAVNLVSYRKDSDDFHYAPNAIYYAEHPRETFDYRIHFFYGGDDCEINSVQWATSLPFEYSQAFLSWAMGIDYLFLYYLFTPALTSFLVPLSLYYLLGFFYNRPWPILLGVIASIGSMLLLGSLHRSMGNFLFFRAQQGKTLLFTAGIPYFSAVSLDYFKSPSTAAWKRVWIIVTAMVGASTSTFLLLPPLGFLLILADFTSYSKRKINFRKGILYSLSFFYLILYAGFLFLKGQGQFLDFNASIQQQWPYTFLGQLSLVVNLNNPTWLFLAGSTSLLVLVFSPGEIRIITATWIAGFLIFFFNPIVVPLWTKYILPESIYWRLYWIYPFPLTMGLSVILAANALREKTDLLKASAVVLFSAALIIPHFIPKSPSVYNYRTAIRFPITYKLPLEDMRTAREILAVAPAGTMLAPDPLAGTIVMLSSNHPQVRLRYDVDQFWLGSCGHPERALIRIRAADFLKGSHVEYYPEFFALLGTEGRSITSIIIHEDALFMRPEVVSVLHKHGFINHRNFGLYSLYWKSTPSPVRLQ